MTSYDQVIVDPDPGEDHSPSDDNGIAGFVIGGSTGNALHPPYYLTSPIVDLSGNGPAVLQFWHWLNGDFGHYMPTTVEVFDGAEWRIIYSTGAWMPYAYGWSGAEYDVSQYANANFRVRWGLGIEDGAFSAAGWNVDDVLLCR